MRKNCMLRLSLVSCLLAWVPSCTENIASQTNRSPCGDADACEAAREADSGKATEPAADPTGDTSSRPGEKDDDEKAAAGGSTGGQDGEPDQEGDNAPAQEEEGEPDVDNTPPQLIAGNALTATYIAPDGVRINWARADDSQTVATELKYRLFQANSDTISTPQQMTVNGTPAGPETADIAEFDVTGLSGNTRYFFNTLVVDEAGNPAGYESTDFAFNHLGNHDEVDTGSVGFGTGPQAAQASERTFYVDQQGGDDGNDGASPASAWQTLQKAADSLQAGDKVLIADGIYRETLVPAASGQDGLPIVYEEAAGASPIVSGADVIAPGSFHSLAQDESFDTDPLYQQAFEGADLSGFNSVTADGSNSVTAAADQAFKGEQAMKIVFDGTQKNARANKTSQPAMSCTRGFTSTWIPASV